MSGFLGFFVGGEGFGEESLSGSSDESLNAQEMNPEEQPNDAAANENESRSQDEATSAAGSEEKTTQPPVVTLLQLLDGSMYGLTEYWIEGNELHYTTTYGGQGSVPLDRIDFDKTIHLNADRGVAFVLRSKTKPQ